MKAKRAKQREKQVRYFDSEYQRMHKEKARENKINQLLRAWK